MRKLQHARRFTFYAVTAHTGSVAAEPTALQHRRRRTPSVLLVLGESTASEPVGRLQGLSYSEGGDMRRFDDAWVVDRTMFEYLNQGGCSCCGVTHQIMDVAMFADRCSDWESDDERKEQFSPWPSFIHEEILTERARLRVVMKEDMAKYKAFLETHAKDFAAWWHKASDSAKTRIFHVPDDEIMEFFRAHVKVKGSYEIVLCAVMEQLRNFQATRYADARTATEAAFEKVLHHEHEVFTVDATYKHTEAGAINFLEMVHALAGPKLLPIRPTQDPAETKKAEKEIAESVANVQSFRSDRRLLRIVIMRKFADVAIRKFLRDSSIATTGNNTEMDEDTELDDDNQTSL